MTWPTLKFFSAQFYDTPLTEAIRWLLFKNAI